LTLFSKSTPLHLTYKFYCDQPGFQSGVVQPNTNPQGYPDALAKEMPAEAKAALDRAGIDIWRIVTGLATEKLAKVQAEADEVVKSATAERDEALAEIERLEASLEKARLLHFV
jgi:hypothetical protein